VNTQKSARDYLDIHPSMEYPEDTVTPVNTEVPRSFVVHQKVDPTSPLA
jgi:hypothetical protein